MFIPPSVSACSLAQTPDWLNFVLNHSLANLNPDCTLTWKTGVVTDLSGNIISPSRLSSLLLQSGELLFLVGAVLTITGVMLIVMSRRRPVESHVSERVIRVCSLPTHRVVSAVHDS
jgi:hypothetical protein